MRLLLAGLILGAVGVAVLDGGGFDPTPQWAFAGTAAAAAGVAALWRPQRAWTLARSAPVVVLLALGAVCALSAAWTISSASGALQAGALAAGYGCLALATAVLARPVTDLAATIAAIATGTAVSGLVSVALLSTHYAERTAHVWQAEGPFGYAHALALLQVGALPFLLRTMVRGRIPAAAAATACAALGVGAVVLSADRLEVALAALVVACAVLFPRQSVGGRTRDAACAAALLAAAALGVHLALGGNTPLTASGEVGRLLLLLLVVGASAAAWAVYRDFAGPRREPERPREAPLWTGAIVAVTAVALAVVVALLSASPLGNRTAAHGSFTHGRIQLFHDSWDAFLDRPGQGYGASPRAFLDATIVRQAERQRVTIFAHDLPLELAVYAGVAGLLLGIALYLAVAVSLLRVRGSPALWLLGPMAAAFLVSNLVDWTWHLAGVGAVFALALGGVLQASGPSLDNIPLR
jgi:O-antigen ligase/polysaccharide polymerase Wzy-like membrane protein